MQRTLAAALAGALLLMAPSCARRGISTEGDICQYARDVLADTSARAFHLLRDFDPKDPEGSIAIVGEPGEVMAITEYMLSCDRYSNISGATTPDGLPDFSGETLSPVLDIANSPYSKLCQGEDGLPLREVAVRNFLSCLDTVCYMTILDTVPTVPRQKAKMVVLSCSYTAAFGLSDIDTLRSLSGSDIPIVSAPNAMVRYSCAHAGNKDVNIGVWASKEILLSGVYASVFTRESERRGLGKIPYEVFSADSASDVKGRFTEFLHRYSLSGNTAKLTSLIIDDPSVPLSELEEVVDRMRTSDDDRDIAYSSMLSDDFVCVDPSTAIAWSCFRQMRSANTFTHAVAYPDMKGYATAKREDGESYVMVELLDRYLPSSLALEMEEKAPNMFSLYVR